MLVPRTVGIKSHAEKDRQEDNKVADPKANTRFRVTFPHVEKSLHGMEGEQWELARFGGPGPATVKVKFGEPCAFVCSCLTEWLSQTKLVVLGFPNKKSHARMESFCFVTSRPHTERQGVFCESCSETTQHLSTIHHDQERGDGPARQQQQCAAWGWRAGKQQRMGGVNGLG